MEGIHFTINLYFRCPRCRVFRRGVFGRVTFNPGRVKLSGRRVTLHIHRDVRFIKLGNSVISGSPFSLSNNRGEQMTVTSIVTVGPRILVLSRPYTKLSPGNESYVLSVVGRCRHSANDAIVVISRSVRSITELYAGICIVGNNGITVDNDITRICSEKGRLGGVNLGVPRMASVFVGLGRHNISYGASVCALRRTRTRLRELLGAKIRHR